LDRCLSRVTSAAPQVCGTSPNLHRGQAPDEALTIVSG